jgi:hypothetical protein
LDDFHGGIGIGTAFEWDGWMEEMLFFHPVVVVFA